MPKQKLTTRGKIVVGVALLIALWFVSTQIWWTNGLCVGDVVTCMNRGR